ncbi:hypothetical protein Tco_1156912 [Tanacetum coccineum]
MGNEPILALLEGADDFVVYYDTRSKDLEAGLEKGEGDCLYVTTTEDKVWTSILRDVRTLAVEEAYTTKYSIHPGADTMLCGFRLTNRWLSMKKDIASCGNMCKKSMMRLTLKKNKADNLDQLVGVATPVVDVNNPSVGMPKGRRKLHIKGGKEKSIEKRFEKHECMFIMWKF